MSRQIPSANFSEMYTHWFSQRWDDLKQRYSNDNQIWDRILSETVHLGQLNEILRHDPPIQHVARFFCHCRKPEQRILAHCILDKHASELMNEMNHPERKALYAAQSGLAKNDPMLAWDVWGCHRSLWKRYIQVDPVVFDPERTGAQLKVLKIGALPLLIDLIPKMEISANQIKICLKVLCKDLSVAVHKKIFALKISGDLKCCINSLLNKLSEDDRNAVLQTPPYENGSWNEIIEKKVPKAASEVVSSPQSNVLQKSCTLAEAKNLRNKRLTCASVKSILMSGLDLEWENNQGSTLLQQVVSQGLASAVPLVLAHEPNIHVRTRTEKASVCILASLLPNANILKDLLENGLNPWLKTIDGKNSLKYAINNLNVKAVEMLTQHPEFDAGNPEYILFLAQCKTSVPQWDMRVINVFNILVKSGANMSWTSKEYTSFVDLLSKRCPSKYEYVIPVIQRVMEDLHSYKQATTIQQHIAVTQNPKTRKI